MDTVELIEEMVTPNIQKLYGEDLLSAELYERYPIAGRDMAIGLYRYRLQDQIIEMVKKLRKGGFRIEMDDFGSGYSSLNMLTSLPIDALKLDMKFIKVICENTKSARLVAIMIDIARLLEVPVIAEGVETKEQMELLKKLGCDIIQGYYFSKPLPPEEFGKLAEKELKEIKYAYN